MRNYLPCFILWVIIENITFTEQNCGSNDCWPPRKRFQHYRTISSYQHVWLWIPVSEPVSNQMKMNFRNLKFRGWSVCSCDYFQFISFVPNGRFRNYALYPGGLHSGVKILWRYVGRWVKNESAWSAFPLNMHFQIFFFRFNVHFSSAEGWTVLAWLDLLEFCGTFSPDALLTTSDDIFGQSWTHDLSIGRRLL